ncbi:MAG: hypothetical protein V4672_15290 [Verrucomicrobiota bacterium]
MRFYMLISKDNTMQRRLLAIAAGLGAGLIYVLGSMIITLLKAPSPSDVPPAVEAVEAVRISGKRS